MEGLSLILAGGLEESLTVTKVTPRLYRVERRKKDEREKGKTGHAGELEESCNILM